MPRFEMSEITELGVKLLSQAEGMADDLVDWRRAFHQFPELGLEEYMTAGKIEGILASLPGMEVVKGFALPTSVIATVGGELGGGAIAFRAEIDAVEVREDTGLPFSSYDNRVSHVQGHDAHMATLLGIATLLSGQREKLKRPVVFIFQPADEGRSGARQLIDAGVIEEFGIEKMLCIHWVPYLSYGKIFTNKGPVTAYSSKVHIGLSGPGGHGSTPHLAPDPLFLAAQIQMALQAMITREVDPQRGAVLSFGRIEAGDVYNVIPEETHLWGTLRVDDRQVHNFMKTRIEEIAKGMARVSRLAAAVEYMLNYGQVTNDDAMVSDIFKYGTALFGNEAMELLNGPLLMGEDFSFFSQKVRSCMMFLGTGMEYGLYHARYDIPENLLPFASAWGAYLALAMD